MGAVHSSRIRQIDKMNEALLGAVHKSRSHQIDEKITHEEIMNEAHYGSCSQIVRQFDNHMSDMDNSFDAHMIQVRIIMTVK